MQRKEVKKQNIQQFVLFLLIIIFLNIVSSYFFFRIDLTTEKRYTLSNKTKTILKNLDDIVYFKVFLDGDLPAQYRKLKNETKTMLEQFRSYNKKNIQFEFIDITAGKDKRQTYQILEELRSKGIQPIIDYDESETERVQKIIIPGAIVAYREKEVPVQLITDIFGPAAYNKDVVINNSIQALEFKLIDAIRKLTVKFKPKVAIIDTYTSLKPVQLAAMERLLSEYYTVERISIKGKLKALQPYTAIIIAKPDSTFSEKDKFIIDQFVMKGGKVLWLIDPVQVEMDSLQNKNQTIALIKNLNVEDILFKYGARINNDLLLDASAIPIPLMTGMQGNTPKFEFFTWPFFPLLISNNIHPIVKNINPVRTEFISSIDTIGKKNIKKTILLTTSKYTRRLNAPVTVSLDIIKEKPSVELYNKSYLPVAVLLEGEFESVFLNRLPPEISESKEIGYKEKSVPNKMIVVSDGDIIKNQFLYKDGRYITYPLGYDRYTNTQYGNDDLLLNMMSYLCDENNLLEIRSRELKIRLLDKNKVKSEKIKWQVYNLIAPIIFVILIAIIFTFVRRKIYN